MKRILSILLILVLCLGVFVACQPVETEKPAATLDDAKAYLAGMYKDSANNLTNDYDLVGKAIVNGVTFTVTWKADIAEITIKESDKKDFWTVDLPDANAEEKAYVLTATIADADGNTTTVTLSRILPVYEKVAGIVNNPVAETAYKLFFTQKNLAKTLFLLAEDTGKFIKTTIDPKAAADFYVEAADNGVKIYTLVDGAKKYLVASTELKEDGKVSKAITYGDNGSVFTYNKDINAWYTVVDNIKYCMGTYGTYDTVSISEDSYYTPENTGVEQFPVEFILKADGEAMVPTEGPADPTELTSIADVIAIGAAKEHNTFTAEKYLVKGTITEIVKADYGNLYIEDEAGNSIYVYGLYSNDGSVRFDAMNPQPKVGDVITVMSIVGQYNDAPQLKNAWLMKLEAVQCTNHVYDNACDASCNTCGAERDVEGHVYDNDCDAKCNVCDAERKVPDHAYDTDCDADCNICGAERDVEGHDYDNECDVKCNICDTDRTPPHKVTAACDTKCDLCGGEVTANADHEYSADCDYDCNVCNTTRDAECKDTDNDGICNLCNETIDESKISRKNVAEEKDNLTISTVAHGKYEETLPTTGKTHSDVTISWRVEGNAATIQDGKAICTATGTANVEFKLIATLTSGDITDTKEFTVKVTPHTYDNDCKDVDCNVEECTATRTAIEHSYDNHLDTECNNCSSGTREATECVDADKNGVCDSCGGDVEIDVSISIPDVLASAEGVEVVVKGTVESFYYAWSDEFNNCSVYIVDAAGNKLLCFRLKTKVNVGDQITVTGTTTLYNNVIQLAEGCTATIDVAHVCTTFTQGNCTVPSVCEVCEKVNQPAPGHNFVGGECSVCGEKEVTSSVELNVNTLGLESDKYTGTADASATKDVNGYTFEFIQIGNYGDGLQMRDKNGNTTSLWNTTAFDKKIARIELVYSSTQNVQYSNANAVIFTFGNSAGEATYTTKLSTQAGVKTYTITPDANTYTFFKLEHDLGYTFYWDSITIYFTE